MIAWAFAGTNIVIVAESAAVDHMRHSLMSADPVKGVDIKALIDESRA
jgi:hypothetical protein